PDSDKIRQLLDSAGYDWQNPLSAAAYIQWYDHLADKQDDVTQVKEAYLIHTSTHEGRLTDASLALDSHFHAVACVLHFNTDDSVGISEIPPRNPAPDPDAPRTEPTIRVEKAPLSPAPSVSVPTPPPGPGEELQVIAALHWIGADLGEPVDVRRNRVN